MQQLRDMLIKLLIISSLRLFLHSFMNIRTSCWMVMSLCLQMELSAADRGRSHTHSMLSHPPPTASHTHYVEDSEDGALVGKHRCSADVLHVRERG